MILAKNATVPLVLPTYDGSGSTVHPAVVNAVAETGAIWNGYTYWMAITPYPSSNDRLENPSILVSNDKLTWQVPPGLTNPIVPAPAVETRHNSDCGVLLEPDGSFLHVVYRESATSGDLEERLYLVSSSDGVAWSSPLQIFASGELSNTLYLSPTIVKAGGSYHMYAVRVISGVNGLSYLTAPDVTGPWVYQGIVDAGTYDGYEPWHVACRLEPNGAIRFIVHATVNGGSSNGVLWLAESSGPGTPLTTLGKVLDQTLNWDADLYRASIIPLDDYGCYGLYYSAFGSSGWRTGYTEFCAPTPIYRAKVTTAGLVIPDVAAGDYEARVLAENNNGATYNSLWVPIPRNGDNTPVNLIAVDQGVSGVLLDWEPKQ